MLVRYSYIYVLGRLRSKMATKLHPILGLAPFVSAAASEIIFKAIDSTGSGVISRAQVIQAQPLSFFCFDISAVYGSTGRTRS